MFQSKRLTQRLWNLQNLKEMLGSSTSLKHLWGSPASFMRSSTQVLPLSCTKDMVQEGSSEPETSAEIAEGSLEAWSISVFHTRVDIQHRTP